MSQIEKSGDSGFLAGVAGDEMKRRMWEGCGLFVLVGCPSELSRQEVGYVGRCLDWDGERIISSR